MLCFLVNVSWYFEVTQSVTLKREGTAVFCNVWNHSANDSVTSWETRNYSNAAVRASNIASYFVTVHHFFLCSLVFLNLSMCMRMAATDQQHIIRGMQHSTDSGTNMTGVGFQVIIYITMFWDMTSSSAERFERHTLRITYAAMEAVLPAIGHCATSQKATVSMTVTALTGLVQVWAIFANLFSDEVPEFQLVLECCLQFKNLCCSQFI